MHKILTSNNHFTNNILAIFDKEIIAVVKFLCQ